MTAQHLAESWCGPHLEDCSEEWPCNRCDFERDLARFAEQIRKECAAGAPRTRGEARGE